MDNTTVEQIAPVDASIPNYVMIKLSAGSNIVVGQLISEDDFHITLYYPITVSMYFDESNVLKTESSKFFPFATDDIVAIEREQIVAIARPKDNIIAFYHFQMRNHAENGGEDFELNVLGLTRKAEVETTRNSPMDSEPPTTSRH